MERREDGAAREDETKTSTTPLFCVGLGIPARDLVGASTAADRR